MEDTLREVHFLTTRSCARRLNPCFNGRYSQSLELCYATQRVDKVLILVLMEDTLRARLVPLP